MLQAKSVRSGLYSGDLFDHRDFRAMIEAGGHGLIGHVNLALFPGDNANDGADAQFPPVQEATDGRSILLHVHRVDHDFHARSLDGFHNALGAEELRNAGGDTDRGGRTR